jgi:hypothetical protein
MNGKEERFHMGTIEELEARVKVLEDERELRRLLTRYAFNADLGRSREYANLYLEDGAIDVNVRYEGREQILWKFITGPGHKSLEGHCQHWTQGPLYFYIHGDEAEAEGYSLVLLRHGESLPANISIFTASFSHWRFRRVDGEWRIVERIVRAIGTEEVPGLATRTTK